MNRKNGKVLVAVTGGIGSGKSVVCRVLSALGYPVYDCDSRAKSLMDASAHIKRRLVEEIDRECVAEGAIDRRRLAACVFADAEKLALLNSIVHGAVRDDIASWVDRNRSAEIMFVETAIAVESGIDRMVDEIWEVTAPVETRIERVMRRNGIARERVVERMASQMSGLAGFTPTPVREVVNDGFAPVLPRIFSLLHDLEVGR